MAVGVAEVKARAAIALAPINLASLLACRVGEVLDGGAFDARECRVEFLVAGQERVVARGDRVRAGS
jgi:hypothetical protein